MDQNICVFFWTVISLHNNEYYLVFWYFIVKDYFVLKLFFFLSRYELLCTKHITYYFFFNFFFLLEDVKVSRKSVLTSLFFATLMPLVCLCFLADTIILPTICQNFVFHLCSCKKDKGPYVIKIHNRTSWRDTSSDWLKISQL